MRRFDFALSAFAAAVLVVATVGCEPEPRSVAPGASPASSSIAVTFDDTRLVIAAEDHNQVLIVDRESHTVLARIDVADGPSHVVVSDGRAFVTTRYGHSLEVIDLDDNRLTASIPVGLEPIGLTLVSPNVVAVVLSGDAAVAMVNVDTNTIESKVALQSKDPRAIAKVGNALFVTHLTSGVMSRIDIVNDVASTDVAQYRLKTQIEGPDVHANLIRSLTVAPDDQVLAMAHSQANADTMRAAIGEGFGIGVEPEPFFEEEPDGGGFAAEPDGEFFEGGQNCGYSGCASQLGANTPALTYVYPTTGGLLSFERAPTEDMEEEFGGEFEDCFDCDFEGFAPTVAAPSNFLAPFENRFLDLPMNNPVALAFADGGRGQLVLNLGTKNLVLMRRDLDGTARDVVGVAQVGNGATSIALTHDGAFAYVWNQFDATVSEIAVPKFAERRRVQGGVFSATERENSAEFEEVREVPSSTFDVVEDALPASVSTGRKLFHSATDVRISQNHTISCATCHPDGRSDNRTWQFTFGPRNTPQLGGGILDTAPFHWPGDVVDIPDLNRMTVLAFMGGNGVDEESMNAIGSYIDTIRPAPSSRALSPELTDAQLRGEALFNDNEVACASCHHGNHLTDNLTWDVATRASQRDISAFQTPVLHGLARSGPYLHDGSSETLLDLVLDVVANDRMGKGSHLTDDDLVDLAAYLEVL